MTQLTAGKPLRVFFYTLLIIIVLIQIYPIFWVISSSLKTSEELVQASYTLPHSFYFGNYIRVLTESKLPLYFLNSIIVAVSVLLGIVVIGAPVAFAISKLRFKQSKTLMSFFLMGMMIPIFASLIHMFRIYNVVGLRNTYLSLILPQIGFNLPISIYLYVGFMKFIPDAIHEAAVIDGAGAFQVFSRIIFPMSKNTTITVVTYNFVFVWNEFTFANTFMTKSEMKTLPNGLNDFIGAMGFVDWGATFAAITLAILPTLVIYFFLNKNVMEGMAAGAVKS